MDSYNHGSPAWKRATIQYRSASRAVLAMERQIEAMDKEEAERPKMTAERRDQLFAEYIKHGIMTRT